MVQEMAKSPVAFADARRSTSGEDSDTPVKEKESAVRVALRIRPLLSQERMERCRECLHSGGASQSTTVRLGRDRAFTFDHVFWGEDSQAALYDQSVRSLVEGCLSGYNATVFAYGQTGSGKTYTMGMGNSVNVLDEEQGILPRAIHDLFAGIREKQEQTDNVTDTLVSCAFLEVYNEEVNDLLDPNPSGKKVAVRENARGNIVVSGIHYEVAKTEQDLMRCFEVGCASRTTGKTLMNAKSSRSHAIFTIAIEQRMRKGSSIVGNRTPNTKLRGQPDKDYVAAKFHLVDLAGSERNKRTGAKGIEEGCA